MLVLPWGVLAITELNRLYLKCGQNGVAAMNHEYVWPSAGVCESPLEVSQLVTILGCRQGVYLRA